MSEPTGATVLVWRRGPAGRELLVLHRAAHPPEFEGDWAWTPPAGAREAGETIEECARRELREETGLELELIATPFGTPEWPAFAVELTNERIVLDAEHDRFEWVSLDEAASRCLPDVVALPIRRFARQHGEQRHEHEVARDDEP